MTEIGNVVFSVEKIDQLKAEIEQAARDKNVWFRG
jgi:hypothetical protein